MNNTATTRKPEIRGELDAIGRLIGKHRKILGALGERLVVRHLENKGFQHLESNFRKKYGELDVIMKKGDRLHFLEVKSVSRENLRSRMANSVNRETYRDSSVHMPEENVGPRKIKKISRMISVYLGERGMRSVEWQFDVAVVLVDQKNHFACIKFIKNVPLAG